MKNLTVDQIQLIDTYLKNSDIQFVDVRAEMVDHVATAVLEKMIAEQLNFYDAFKWYMVDNKKHLLKNYERVKKRNQWQSFSELNSLLLSWQCLVLFLALFFLVVKFKGLFGFEFPYINYLWAILFATMGVYFVAMLPKKKFRFSKMEALAWPLVLLQYIMIFMFNITHAKPLLHEELPILSVVFTAFSTCICACYLIRFFQLRKAYQKRYMA